MRSRVINGSASFVTSQSERKFLEVPLVGDGHLKLQEHSITYQDSGNEDNNISRTKSMQ
jgi:hypothetical protein